MPAEKNLSGKSDILDGQINAFKAYWLIMAIFHEVKTNQPLFKSVKHVRKCIKENKSTKGIKLKFIFVSLAIAKVVNNRRN